MHARLSQAAENSGRRTTRRTTPLHPPRGKPARETPKAPDLSGAFGLCALGRIRTCNLLIRSQMLYPLSYECLFFCFCLRFRPFRPVPATRRTLHDCHRHVKSVRHTPSDLRKRRFGGSRASAGNHAGGRSGTGHSGLCAPKASPCAASRDLSRHPRSPGASVRRGGLPARPWPVPRVGGQARTPVPGSPLGTRWIPTRSGQPSGQGSSWVRAGRVHRPARGVLWPRSRPAQVFPVAARTRPTPATAESE